MGGSDGDRDKKKERKREREKEGRGRARKEIKDGGTRDNGVGKHEDSGGVLVLRRDTGRGENLISAKDDPNVRTTFRSSKFAV